MKNNLFKETSKAIKIRRSRRFFPSILERIKFKKASNLMIVLMELLIKNDEIVQFFVDDHSKATQFHTQARVLYLAALKSNKWSRTFSNIKEVRAQFDMRVLAAHNKFYRGY